MFGALGQVVIGKLLWTKTADRKKILGGQEQLESPGPSDLQKGFVWKKYLYCGSLGERWDQRWSEGVGSSLSSGNSSGTSEFTHRNHGAGGVETEGSY